MEDEKETQNGRFEPGNGVLNMAQMSNGGKNHLIKGTIVSASFPVNETDGSLRKDSVDIQIITDLDANSPRIDVHLNCMFDDEMYGRTLVFNGFMRGDGVFITDSVDYPDNIYDMSFSEDEIEQIEQASNDPDFFKNLIRSIAPSIVGMDDVKEILALQLFGGVRREFDEFCTLGNIHVLLLADPDTAVYTLTKTMSRLFPRGLFLSKNENRGTPFNGEGVKGSDYEGNISIMVGAITVANGGIVCLDDIDCLNEHEIARMHLVISEGHDDFYNCKYRFLLPSDTSLLCIAPPRFGRIIKGVEIREQINHIIIRKFDLLIPIRDVPEIEHDRIVAEGILNKHLRGNALKMEDGELKKEILYRTGNIAPVYSEEFIRKYVAYSRLNCRPDWPESSRSMLVEKYLPLVEKYHITGVDYLDSVIHFAEASAKMRLSYNVEDIDISRSIPIMENYLIVMNKMAE